jgi:hypothetical protein
VTESRKTDGERPLSTNQTTARKQHTDSRPETGPARATEILTERPPVQLEAPILSCLAIDGQEAMALRNPLLDAEPYEDVRVVVVYM